MACLPQGKASVTEGEALFSAICDSWHVVAQRGGDSDIGGRGGGAPVRLMLSYNFSFQGKRTDYLENTAKSSSTHGTRGEMGWSTDVVSSCQLSVGEFFCRQTSPHGETSLSFVYGYVLK